MERSVLEEALHETDEWKYLEETYWRKKKLREIAEKTDTYVEYENSKRGGKSSARKVWERTPEYKAYYKAKKIHEEADKCIEETQAWKDSRVRKYTQPDGVIINRCNIQDILRPGLEAIFGICKVSRKLYREQMKKSWALYWEKNNRG